MAIDIIARGLATSLIGENGKVANDKMPVMSGTSELTGFSPLGHLTDPTQIEGKTAEELLLMMLYGVSAPKFTNPSLEVELNNMNSLIRGEENIVSGTIKFNRGSIVPAYGTSGYRAGAAISYKVLDTEYNSTVTEFPFEVTITPTTDTVDLVFEVQHAEGEQPKNSIGADVDAPYPAGKIQVVKTVSANYPLYTASGALLEHSVFEDETGKGYIALFASEGSGEKQSFVLPISIEVIGIQAFNTMTQSWDWLGGFDAAYSLTQFNKIEVSGELYNHDENCYQYIHNQPASGERELRIYIA